MSKEQNNNNKAFTLIELLAIAVLLGLLSYVGMTAFSGYIEKSKKENELKVKELLLSSAKDYIEENNDLAPKAIGDYLIISAKELKQSKKLISNIKSSKEKSCLNNSFVRVYKSEGVDYSYTAYLYCGSEKKPNKIETLMPIIKKLDFSNIDDISETSFTMTLEGSEDKNNPLEIDNYNFTISAIFDNNEYQEIYNSGSIPGNHNTSISKTHRLVDYIEMLKITTVRVNVTIINEQGGITSITKQTEINSIKDHSDTISPKCTKIENEAKQNEWINKNTIDNISAGYRKITATCNDGEGSGCIKSTFTKSFPNNDIYRGEKHYYWGAEYAYIEIKDKAGNSSLLNSESKKSCRVRVNVDILSPRVEVTATTNETIIKTVSAGGADEQYNEYPINATIKANSYNLNKSPRDDKLIWFNEEYKDGVIYKVKVGDNLHLYKYTWETNTIGISKKEYNKNKNIINNININNPDGKEETFKEQDLEKNDNGLTNAEFIVQLKGEGIRYGKLTVYDIAGNKTIINIYANIDRTRPDIPPVVVAKTLKRNNIKEEEDQDYNLNNWTNKYVKTYISKNYHIDSISGFDTTEYEVRGHGVSINENATKKGENEFIFDSHYQGKNYIRYRICDNANNCSLYGDNIEIWLDTISPTCEVKQTVNKISEEADGVLSAAGWAGIGESITVTGLCSDQDSENRGSGCVTKKIETEYKDSINTSHAGPGGDNKGGSLKDNAGNEAICSNNEIVKIDHNSPLCNVSIEYEITDNSKGDGKLSSSGWLSKGEQAVVSAKCSETSGINSGCVTNTFSKTYNFEIEIDNAGAVNIGEGGIVKDAADNIASCPANKVIKIDQTNPECNLSISYEGGDKKTHDGTESGWLSKGETARVTATCSDSGGSTCQTPTFSKLYQTDKILNTTTAGAGGDGISKYVSDTAGNKKICGYKTVRIDSIAPTCHTENCNNTSWSKNDRIIKYGCQDINGSGCSTQQLQSKTISNTTKSFDIEQYEISDIAGNTRTCTPNCNVLVDKNKPTGTCSIKNNKIVVDSKNDEHSGISNILYMSSKSNKKQSETSKNWKEENTLDNDCDNTYYGHIKIIDKAGNEETVICSNSYKAKSCCDENNPWNCEWKTACREGNTYIYTSSEMTTYAGTVYHKKGSKCSDKLYLIDGNKSNRVYVHSPCNKAKWFKAANKTKPIAYIYSNCIGEENEYCSNSTCPK